MFFRRKRPQPTTSEQKLDELVKAGFAVDALGDRRFRVARDAYAAILEKAPDGEMQVVTRGGLVIGDEVGALVDGGFQKFFQAPSGRRKPALASELKGLHDFNEDLREALGIASYYNESLGTVSAMYLYDRLKDRDAGVPKRIWEE
jgi:hypothetical protein